MGSISETGVAQAHDLAQLYDNIEAAFEWSQEAIYDLEPDAVDALHLHWLRRRFNELRPKIRALDKLAQDIEIDEIKTIDDVVPLCFPRTMLKAYSLSDLEKRRFDRMARWLVIEDFDEKNLANTGMFSS